MAKPALAGFFCGVREVFHRNKEVAMNTRIRLILASAILLVILPLFINASEEEVREGMCVVTSPTEQVDTDETVLAHGGGLNACGCHFNRKTGQCHCHRPRGCGCACQPASCNSNVPDAQKER